MPGKRAAERRDSNWVMFIDKVVGRTGKQSLFDGPNAVSKEEGWLVDGW